MKKKQKKQKQIMLRRNGAGSSGVSPEGEKVVYGGRDSWKR